MNMMIFVHVVPTRCAYAIAAARLVDGSKMSRRTIFNFTLFSFVFLFFFHYLVFVFLFAVRLCRFFSFTLSFHGSHKSWLKIGTAHSNVEVVEYCLVLR